MKMLLLTVMLGAAAAFSPAISTTHRPGIRVSAHPMCVTGAQERRGALGWARGRVAATRNLFRGQTNEAKLPKAKVTIFKKKEEVEDDGNPRMEPLMEFAGALLGATASAGAAATAAAATAIGEIDLSSD